MRRYYFFAFLALGILGCNKDSANKEICIIQNLTVTIGECSGDSTYALTIDFDVENAGNSSFDVFIRNNEFVGNYPLSSLPLTINDFRKSGRDEDFIKICINDNADCCAAAEFSPPACEVPTCSISNLVLSQGECTSDSTYSMTIDFDVQNPSNASFDVFIRNNVAIGFFPISSLPVTIPDFPISGKDYDYVKVCINDNNSCCKAEEILSKNCE
jgi:hypothetical protein